MADNVAITAGAGTNVAADDISSVFYQRVKLTWGVDGVASDANATTPLPVRLQPLATGGATMHSLLTLGTTNLTTVKASAGTVYSLTITNSNSTARYFKMYDKASNPVLASDTPVWRILVPGSGGIALPYPNGLAFATGIAYATTVGAADTNANVITANDLTINISYA